MKLLMTTPVLFFLTFVSKIAAETTSAPQAKPQVTSRAFECSPLDGEM